jgi:hypothetical protein
LVKAVDGIMGTRKRFWTPRRGRGNRLIVQPSPEVGHFDPERLK